MAQDILGYFRQYHGLGYFGDTFGNIMAYDILGILLAISWPTISWGYFWQYHGLRYFGDTFGNIMAYDILGILLAISWPTIFWGYFWQYHGLRYFGTSIVQGYKRRQSGEQLFSKSTLVDGSIKLVLSCNSPLVCSRSITVTSYLVSHKLLIHNSKINK